MMTTDAALAVSRSISHGEVARLRTNESYSGQRSRMTIALDALRGLGLEDYSEEQPDLWDCWGTRGGVEWRVKVVDMLEGRPEVRS